MLNDLCQILEKVQRKYSEDLWRLLTSKLTETQASLISKEVAQKMTPFKSVNMVVDDLVQQWVISYYQKMTGQLKQAIDMENWAASELEDNVADVVQYIAYLGNLPETADPIIILKKHVVLSSTERYNLTSSYVVLLQVVHAFFELIFEKHLGSSAVSMLVVRLAELVTVEQGYLELHPPHGKPDLGGQGAREEDHREDLVQTHFTHHHGDQSHADSPGRQVFAHPRPQRARSRGGGPELGPHARTSPRLHPQGLQEDLRNLA